MARIFPQTFRGFIANGHRDLTFSGADSENSQVAPAQAFSRKERVGERGARRLDATAPVQDREDAVDSNEAVQGQPGRRERGAESSF